MFDYLRGKITKQFANYITVDVNGVGYKVYVSNPYKFTLNEENTVYVYCHVREDENSLYGFKSIEEKELFIKLISVKGLGCKMALPILTSDKNDVYSAIDEGNINYLKKFPKIGEKLARQIVLDLKGKLAPSNTNDKNYDDLIDTLKALGYKPVDIKKILPNIDSKLPIENQVKEALKLLLK